jgi:hypothetical protein
MERGCLRLLHVPPGKKLTDAQYHVAGAVTFYLLTRSAEAAPSRLVRFLETTQPDAPPEQTFFECWGVSMDEACRAVVSSAHSDSRIRGQGPGVRFNR